MSPAQPIKPSAPETSSPRVSFPNFTFLASNSLGKFWDAEAYSSDFYRQHRVRHARSRVVSEAKTGMFKRFCARTCPELQDSATKVAQPLVAVPVHWH